MLFQQKGLPRGAATYQALKIHQLFKAFSDVRKSQFLLPSDRSQNAKVQGGAFCRTSPAKLKIRTFQRPHLGASISFGSLYVRVWRCLQISNLRRRWVGSGWSIPSGLLFAQKTMLLQQLRLLRGSPRQQLLNIRQLFTCFSQIAKINSQDNVHKT